MNTLSLICRFQSLIKVPVRKVLQQGAYRDHGAIGGREVHPDEHSSRVQVSRLSDTVMMT